MHLMDLLLLNVLWNLWPNRKFRQSPHFLKPQRPWLFSFQNYYSILVRGYVDVLHIRVHGVPNYVLSFTQGDCQKQVLWKNIVQRNTWTGWELPQRGFKCEIKGTMWGFRPVSITGMKVDLIFPLAEEKSILKTRSQEQMNPRLDRDLRLIIWFSVFWGMTVNSFLPLRKVGTWITPSTLSSLSFPFSSN